MFVWLLAVGLLAGLVNWILDKTATSEERCIACNKSLYNIFQEHADPRQKFQYCQNCFKCIECGESLNVRNKLHRINHLCPQCFHHENPGKLYRESGDDN